MKILANVGTGGEAVEVINKIRATPSHHALRVVFSVFKTEPYVLALQGNYVALVVHQDERTSVIQELVRSRTTFVEVGG